MDDQANESVVLGLEFREPDRWRDYWREAKVGLVVAGDAQGPDPALEATMQQVVDRWDAVKRTVSEYVAALAADEHVALEPASLGGFAAGNCGFDGELFFESISVIALDEPTRVELTFYTGYPDGYATYCVVLVDGRPVEVTSFAS